MPEERHTQLNIGWKVRPKYGLGCTTNVRMVIQLAKDLEWTIAHSLQSNRVVRSFEFTRHSSIVGIPVENNTGTKEWTKMARSIMISRILKRWWNSHHILDKKLTKRDGNTSEVRKIKCWVARNSRYNTKHEQACVGGKAIKWSMITQIIKGKDGISHHEFNWYPGWAQNVDDHDTFVARVHEDVSNRRWHQVKGMMMRKVIGTKGTTQTQNQVCCSRDNTDHQGQGWYFSSWIQLISWMSSECWWSRHLCRESSWRCKQSAMTSSQRNDDAKGYWNQGYDTNSKSSLLF